MVSCQLYDKAVEAISIVPFPAELFFFYLRSNQNYFCFSAPLITAIAVAFSVVALVAVASDLPTVTLSAAFAPIFSKPALLPLVPLVPTCLLSSLAISASTIWSLNTPAPAIVPGIGLQQLCRRQAYCNAEYTDPENCFSAREVYVKYLTAEVQYDSENITLPREQDGQL